MPRCRTCRSTCGTSPCVCGGPGAPRAACRLPRRTPGVSARPAARPDPKPDPAFRPGPGDRGRGRADAGDAVRALHPHADVRGALCRADGGAALGDSAHAKDIWTTPASELAEKLADSLSCVTCTEPAMPNSRAMPGRRRTRWHSCTTASTSSAFRRRRRVPCAVAMRCPRRCTSWRSDGRSRRKGWTLDPRLALLPPDFHWHFTHVGDGPLQRQLADLARSLGLAERCRFAGALPTGGCAAYREADLFALPCRVDASGDRDGLPNVIVEAFSQGLAVISTPLSGIPERSRTASTAGSYRPRSRKRWPTRCSPWTRPRTAPEARRGRPAAGARAALAPRDDRCVAGATRRPLSTPQRATTSTRCCSTSSICWASGTFPGHAHRASVGHAGARVHVAWGGSVPKASIWVASTSPLEPLRPRFRLRSPGRARRHPVTDAHRQRRRDALLGCSSACGPRR